MRIINKLLSKFGYVKYNKTADTLYHMAMESMVRDGEMQETDITGARFKVAAKSYYRKY